MSAVAQDLFGLDQPAETNAPKQMTDEELILAIDDAFSRTYGSNLTNLSSELSAERALNIDLYLGKDVDPAPEGESSVVDRAVFETVQWVLPSLCRIFANGDNVVTLVPSSEKDVEPAKQETAYLNWLVTTKHPWFDLFLEWATDALLTKNAYFLVYRDLRRSVEIEKYEGQTKIGIAYLLREPNTQLIDARQYPAPDLPQEPVINPQTGQPVMQQVGVDPMSGQPIMQPVMQPAMLYDCVIRRQKSSKELCIRVLPPERVNVDQLTPSWRVDENCNYFEYWEDTTISSLREQGFEIDDATAADLEADTQEDQARDQFSESMSRLNDGMPSDPSMRRVRARMIWFRVDADGDGQAELLQTMRVGRKIFYREEVSRIPVASGVACPLPHRHVGLALADQVADIQIIRTVLLRQGLNNLYLSNNPQKVINPSFVSVDDALVSRPGGLIQATDINQIRYEQPPFVFPQAVSGLEYMSQVMQSRTGINPGFSQIDTSTLNNVQPGTVNQLSSMAAERVVQIARILAFAIEDLFSIVHEQTLKMGHKKETLQISGKWIDVDPGSWKTRTNFKIAVAFSAGNKDSQISRLMAMKQAQVEALTAGIPVVTPENYYQTLMELTKAADFTAPDRFWTDPIKMAPKPPPPPPPEIIKAQMDNESTEKIKAAELEQRERESLRKSELEVYAIDATHGFEIIHKKIEHGHTVALEGLKASHAAILDMSNKFDTSRNETQKAVEKAHDSIRAHTAGVEDTLGKMLQNVERAGKLATAKKRLRKNDRGEIEGIDLLDHDGTVLAQHKALKDSSGRVVGME